MSREIQLTIGGNDVTCQIDLLEEEAPQTVEAIWTALPIEGTIVNGKFSGEEVFTELTEDLHDIGPENWEFNAAPRDVGYWFSHWADGKSERHNPELAEIVFVYGRKIRIRKGPDRPSAINLFGKVTDGFEEFVSVARKTQREGEKQIRLSKVE